MAADAHRDFAARCQLPAVGGCRAVSAPKRVLVTGAGGFIGRWSITPLLNMGYEVHAVLSRSSQRAPPGELRGARLHTADLLDPAAVDTLLDAVSPSHLLHFAWMATPGVYWQSPDNALWLNASQHLLRRFKAVAGRRAVMAGSCAEYDWARAGVCVERSTPLADEAGTKLPAYVANKLAMQRMLAQFGAEDGLSTAWGRIFFQFGPHEHPHRLVSSVIRHLLLDQEALCTHGRQVRSFLHVADVGAAFAQLLDGDVQGPVNIGSDERVSLAELIDRIARKIGRSDRVRLGARSTATEEPPLLVPDIQRLRDEVGFEPRYSLNQAIDDTIAWWRSELGLAERP
jgi:nucleoside-diphosphate-sugar epimerase